MTKVKVEQWRAEHDPLRWNAKGSTGPRNRHRIPDPAPIFVGAMSPGRDGTRNSLSPQTKAADALNPKNYEWDLDGRRHHKSRKESKKDPIPDLNQTALPLLSNKSVGPPTQTNIDIRLHHNSSIDNKPKMNKIKSSA